MDSPGAIWGSVMFFMAHSTQNLESHGETGLWRSFQPEHPKRLQLGAGVQGQAPCGWGRVFGALFISPKK